MFGLRCFSVACSRSSMELVLPTPPRTEREHVAHQTLYQWADLANQRRRAEGLSGKTMLGDALLDERQQCKEVRAYDCGIDDDNEKTANPRKSRAKCVVQDNRGANVHSDDARIHEPVGNCGNVVGENEQARVDARDKDGNANHEQVKAERQAK